MLNKITDSIQFSAETLKLRAHRQEVITSNIANVDTPNYKAVDFNFKSALHSVASKAGLMPNASGSAPLATTTPAPQGLATTHAGHISSTGARGSMSTSALLEYRRNVNPAMDNNTVDLEKERAAFAENTIKYQAAIRALNDDVSGLKTAMGNGQG